MAERQENCNPFCQGKYHLIVNKLGQSFVFAIIMITPTSINTIQNAVAAINMTDARARPSQASFAGYPKTSAPSVHIEVTKIAPMTTVIGVTSNRLS